MALLLTGGPAAQSGGLPPHLRAFAEMLKPYAPKPKAPGGKREPWQRTNAQRQARRAIEELTLRMYGKRLTGRQWRKLRLLLRRGRPPLSRAERMASAA